MDPHISPMFSNKNHLNSSPYPNEPNKVVKNIIHLLAEGEKKLKNQHKVENAVMILGGSGAGKTTFAYTIAGYDAMLTSNRKFLQYIITKLDSDVIEDSYTTSTTIFPELLLNNQTKTVYYDFPGFEDTRGAIYDITTTYFIKKVLNNVKRIKMLFLVNYSAFSIRGERDTFTKLIRHITKFIKNIDKFKNSMALIATKVSEPVLSNNQIVETIADFMKEAKQQLKNQRNKANDHSREIKLIDSFLFQKEKKYPKIGIFKIPNQEGPLKDIPLIQENKKDIENLLQNLSFNEKIESDFGYFIPKQSLHEVGKMIEEINKSIMVGIKKGGQEIQKYLSNKEDKLYDVFESYNKISSQYEELLTVQETANKHIETENCVQEIVQGVGSIYGNSGYQNFVPLTQYGTFVSFLHNISDHSITDSFKCAVGLNEVIVYLFNSKKWYHFLKQLFVRLSEYEVQKNIPHNNPCIKFADELSEGVKRGKYSATVFFSFLKECFPMYDYEQNGILKIKLDKPKLNSLLRVIESTMMYPLDITSCDFEKLTIKKQYVLITADILNAIANKCKNIPPKFIVVFALNKIFIDSNLNLISNYQVQLSIIAPTWDIQGSPRIILEGGPGEAHNSANAPNGTNFIEDKKHGQPGIPGLPGQPGGNFLGIGDTFINPEYLTISVNGGQGGPGQNGGDGGIGVDGSNAEYDVYTEGCTFLCLHINGGIKSRNHTIKEERYQEGPLYSENIVLLAGKDGTVGGKGGNGGRGGYGGHSGNIEIIPLSYPTTTAIHMEMNNGKLGLDGNGGKGGAGGKYGDDLEVIYPMTFYPLRNIYTNIVRVKTQVAAGKDGVKGGNIVDMKLAEPNHSFSNLSIIVNDYKTFAKENLNHSVIESYLIKFLSKLESKNLLVIQANKRHKKRDVYYGYGWYDEIYQKKIHNNHQNISNHPRRRRNVMHYSENIVNMIRIDQENEQFQSSSANIAKTPLNNAINLMSNILAPFELFYRFNLMNYNVIKGGILSMFRGVEQFNIHTTKNCNTHATGAVKFNVNESLTLADFFIRWLTNMKPCKYVEEKQINSFEVRASVLNIIEKFERMLNDISTQYNVPAELLEFNPIILISRLEKEVINGNFDEIGRILSQSIANKSISSNDIYFCN